MADLQNLEAAIQSPALKTVYAHWQQARGARPMPAWREIDPTAIGRYLPKVWAWRFDVAQNTFIGRLAGEDILAVMQHSMRGRRFADCFPAATAVALEALYRKVIDGPAIMRATGRVYVQTGKHGWGERIMLPLAGDGVTGDGVLGVTDYRLNAGGRSGVDTATDLAGEEITFYPLT
ncbi:MAG: hypothetical protein JWO51_706 [Rhodospirillales bacterium]|nr:hypothetical protein [Rhodospirillales bacterium]